MIYFDNAATTWPKPSSVKDAMVRCMNECGANPGRGGHRMANDAARIVYETRESVCSLFHFEDPLRVVFTQNITEALNLVLTGFLNAGDHVITSAMEHNSMIRPIRYLQKIGVELSVVPCDSQGFIDPQDIKRQIRSNTVLIALNHASNVTGTIQPVVEIGHIARENEMLFLLDTAQSAGVVDIDMERNYIDFLAFTGHKSLYGPMGTGGLIFGNRVNAISIKPLKMGGTGSRSSEEIQPDFLPDKFESGTLNVAGLAGLDAGIKWILEQGIDTIHQHEMKLVNKLHDGLTELPGITIYSPVNSSLRTATISFNIKSVSPSEAGLIFDEQYDLFCRVGLHCSPSSHKTIGTFPEGTIRFGLGAFNTEDEVDTAIRVVGEITKRI